MSSFDSWPPPQGDYEYFKNEITETCQSIAEHWALLKKILDRDYKMICHTWRGQENSFVKRSNVLDRALDDSPKQPGIPEKRRPDINGYIQRDNPQGPDYKPFNAYQFPYLSREDLVYGENILIFAYCRARYHWTEYLHTDLYSMRAGQLQPSFHGFWARRSAEGPEFPVEPPKETIGKLLRFKKRDFGEIRKGQPCHFDDYCEEYSSTTQSDFERKNLWANKKVVARGVDVLDSFSYSQALLIVRTQKRLLIFLVHVCLDIVWRWKDPSGNNLSKEVLKKEYEEYQFQNKDLSAPKSLSGGAIPLLAEVRLRAAYGRPDGFEWDALEKLIDARLTNARITLLQLRKDPDIFEATLRREEWKRDVNYNPLAVVDLEPKQGEFDGPNRLKAWQDAMKFGIGYAIKDFDWWSELQDAFTHLRATYEECKERLQTKDKSEDFWAAAKKLDTALYGFYYRAHHFSETLVQELRNTILTTSYFKENLSVQNISGYSRLLPTEALRKEGPRKRIDIFAKLARIFSYERQQFGLSALLDDLEREMMDTPEPNQPEDEPQETPMQNAQNEGPSQDAGEGPSTGQKKKKKKKKAKAKSSDEPENSNKGYLTEEVLKVLGNLAVFAECLSQVEHFQPWTTLYFADWNQDPQKEAVRESVARLDQHFRELTGSDRAWKKHFEKGLPKRRRFNYPIEELRTQQNVELLELAESNLDLFWHDLVQELKPDKQDALSARARALLSKTPERPRWIVQRPEEQGGEKPMPDVQGEQDQTPNQEKEQLRKDTEMRDVPEAAEASRPKTPSPPKRPREEDEEPPEQSPAKKKKDKAPAAPTASKKDRRQEPSDTDQSDKIQLPKKLYPHILCLFCIPGRTDARKKLQWRDFLKLMTHIGFSFRQTTGSICKFEPVSEKLLAKLPPAEQNSRGDLEVHGPHPETFLRFWQCRRIGDSMHAKYKWTADTFESL